MLRKTEALTELEKAKIFAKADIQTAQILADAEVAVADLQAYVGALEIERLAETESQRIAAVKEIENARARLFAEMGPEARMAIESMEAERTERARIRAAATVASIAILRK